MPCCVWEALCAAPVDAWRLVSLQLEEHGRALRLLALVLCDIRLAEAYCARYAGAGGHAQLLELLLHPGDGREPLYADACHLLAAQGVRVSPEGPAPLPWI